MRSLGKRLFINTVSFFICLSIAAVPTTCFALNEDLVSDEMYWIDEDAEIIYSDEYFNGFLKYIADEDEGCFYLCLRFTDSRIDSNCTDNITLAFTVKNDVNTYYFQVDRDGVIKSKSQNSLNSFDVYYNFDEASCKRQGGGVFAAFRLKNETDRRLNNYISCEYYCGLSCTYDLFENISLDMYVPTTVKTTAQKTTKQSTTKKNAGSTQSKTSKAAESTKAESSTKFSGSGTVSARSGTGSTKFYADTDDTKSNTGTESITEEETDVSEFEQESFAQTNVNSSTKLSRQAKLLLIIFAVLFAIGILCVIIGTVSNKKTNEPDGENEPKNT